MLLVIIFSIIGGIISLFGGIILIKFSRIANLVQSKATPFSAGALLGVAFFELAHEAIEHQVEEGLEIQPILMTILGGFVVFFLLERFLHWFHHHHGHQGNQHNATVKLLVIGDTIHNFIDGIAIATAFLIDTPTGIVTTIAVASHEIPQEIGDFAIMLNKGLVRRKVLKYNLISAMATVVGAVIAYSIGSSYEIPSSYILAIVAGFFIYISASDLIPEIHENTKRKKLLDVQTILFLLGIVIIYFTTTLAHQFISE